MSIPTGEDKAPEAHDRGKQNIPLPRKDFKGQGMEDTNEQKRARKIPGYG